ncbi:carbohydrate ABC transporter permease [Paenibacillus thalictri]|nr:carbohydrate ABC transporter permease [Paenibacillus thalictri]
MKRKRRVEPFDVVNVVLLGLLGALSVVPFIHVAAKSVSGETAVLSGDVSFWPIGFSLKSLQFVMMQSSFFQSFLNSVFITVLGTLLSLAFTVLAAYPLSKGTLKGKRLILWLYVFCMLFHGGIIPTYMLIKGLGLLNTLWSIIVPTLIIPFNMLVAKTFFEGLPDGLEESAEMDGAGYMRILVSIVLPVSLPMLATLGLFYAVHYWNSFFYPVLFISKPEMKPLQVFLYDMITSTESATGTLSADEAFNLSTEGVRSATIVVSTIPILLVYPFLQKYFVKGLTIGSVKG